LEHKTEEERIVFEDPDPKNGFILLPDMKWDGKVESMYLLAIMHQKDIKSIRDLNGSHIELLENVVEKGLAAIKQKYNVSRNKIRVYFHYFPSFYHLHVHFTHINFESSSERNYSIFRAIENLKLDGDYFKKVALEIPIRKNEKLFELFKHKIED
jgi:m7GpppX diphosphatase